MNNFTDDSKLTFKLPKADIRPVCFTFSTHYPYVSKETRKRNFVKVFSSSFVGFYLCFFFSTPLPSYFPIFSGEMDSQTRELETATQFRQ